MRRVDKLENDEKLRAEIEQIIRIGNEAVKKAKEENRKLGISNTFWKDGKVYYRLPSEEVTVVPPAIMKG
jgi:hypothetical protein